MQGKFIAASGTAALLLFAASIDAKPINSLEGCAYTTFLSPTASYAQTFRPTFSVLRKVRFALFEAYEPYGDVTFRVVLKDQSGTTVAASADGVLTGSTGFDDAASGDAVTFTFAGGVRVTPGRTYTLELERTTSTGTSIAQPRLAAGRSDQRHPLRVRSSACSVQRSGSRPIAAAIS